MYLTLTFLLLVSPHLGFSFSSKHSGFLNRWGKRGTLWLHGEGMGTWGRRAFIALTSHFCGSWALVASGGYSFSCVPLPLPTHLEGTWVGLSSSLISYEPPSLHFLPSFIKVPWHVEFMFVSSSLCYLGVIFDRKMGHEYLYLSSWNCKSV